MDSAQPSEGLGLPLPPDIVDRFIEELYHSTSTLARSSESAVAFSSEAGLQWFAADDCCACCRLPAMPPACLDGDGPRGRVCASLPVDYEGRNLGTVIVCCERSQRSLIEAVRQLVYAALRQVELEGENESLVEELSASWESLEAVYEVSADMRLLQEPADVLNRITAKAVTIQQGLRAVLWRQDGGQLIPVCAKDATVSDRRPSEEGLIGEALAQRRAIILNGRERIRATPSREQEFQRAASLALIPVATRQGVLGVLAVWQEQEASDFDSRTIRLLETLALQAAMVIENERLHRESIESERLRQEIQIGSEIQQVLLLGQPPGDLSDLSIAAITIPSQRVDGDFYEFVQHHDRCLDVIVGDVMGKGIPAALLGAATKSHFLRAIGRLHAKSAPGKLAGPAAIVTAVSMAVTKQLIDIESFVTLCYARLDLDSYRLQLVDCGHTRTILFRRRTGTCEFLQGRNLPLGVIEGETYQEMTTSFEGGDVLLFYSDGVTETHDAHGHVFGEDFLAALIQEHAHRSPDQLIDAIRAGVTRFCQSETFADDFTCVAVKVGEVTVPTVPVQTSMDLTSDLTELARVRDFIVRLRSPRQPHASTAEDWVHPLVQAVNEAVTNIIEHAYGGQSGRPIRLETEVTEDRTTVRIYDWGEAFDPAVIEPPAFDGSRESGFGVYIIAQSVDDVRYARDAQGRNCISLMKVHNQRGGGKP
jgi:sigma-B regulation protein RsbU (phosphoserine phosphatase)